MKIYIEVDPTEETDLDVEHIKNGWIASVKELCVEDIANDIYMVANLSPEQLSFNKVKEIILKQRR